MRRLVLLMGEASRLEVEMEEALRSRGLNPLVVRCESEAVDVLARGEKPHAILLLDSPERHGDRLADRGQAAHLPDSRMEWIRAQRGLELVPVMYYSAEDGCDPSPEELAALVAAAAAMTDVPCAVPVEENAHG
jgi:hypothetical protein